jgi:hypothetical protein
MTKLCIALAALALITRARVALLPGWVVPAPALLLAAMVALCAPLAALVVLRVRADRPRLPAVPAPAAHRAERAA